MFSAATSGRSARGDPSPFSIGPPIAPVEELTTTSSTESRIASVIAWKSSISYDGVPSGLRAWMWIIDPPSSTTRRASAAYSSGVYGIAGHWSRFATVPEIELVMITGSSKRLTPASPPGRSYGHHAVLLPGSLHALALRHLERADHDRPRLTR